MAVCARGVEWYSERTTAIPSCVSLVGIVARQKNERDFRKGNDMETESKLAETLVQLASENKALKAENERLKRELDVSVKYGVDFKQAWDECREKLKNSPNPVSVECLMEMLPDILATCQVKVGKNHDINVRKLAQALFDRIYGKGECEQCGACEELIIPEHVKEFANKYGIGLDVIYEYALRWAELKVMKKFNKRNYDAIAQEIKETITDKPKEYCQLKQLDDFFWNGLPEDGVNKALILIARLKDKLNEVIEYTKQKGV
jgi:hypothetical protein